MSNKYSTDSIVVIKNLTKRYRRSKEYALRGINLTIHRGEFFGLLGPNGSGKTTMISILCGLLTATEGCVEISGAQIPKQLDGIKGKFNLVPQELALYPTLTLKENLQFFARLYAIPRNIIKKRIAECLEIAGLVNYANHQIKTFSGGMKRRANLVVSLLNHPELLILDEPTVNVDPQSRNVIFNILKQLNESSGVTIIYTTHYLEEAEQLCKKVAIIDHGKVIRCDTPEKLIESTHGSHNLAEVFFHLTGKELRDDTI